MNLTEALDLISRYSQDWNNIEASRQELNILKSAVKMWLQTIQNAINALSSNTLELRHRGVARGEVLGRPRSFVHRRNTAIRRNSSNHSLPHADQGGLDGDLDAESDPDALFVGSSLNNLVGSNLTPAPVENFRQIDEVSSQLGDDGEPTFFQDEMDAIERANDEMNHLLGFDPAALLDSPLPHESCLSVADFMVYSSYLRSACEIGFRLLYPEENEVMSVNELEDFLRPLVQGTPLTKTLIYNLLLMLVPMPLILVLDPQPEDWKTNEDGLLAVFEGQHLILSDSRMAMFIGNEYIPQDFDEMFRPGFLIQTKKPADLRPEIESTLGMVYLAIKHTGNPIKLTTAHALRMEFIKTLLGPYQSETVLRGLGIEKGPVACRRISDQKSLFNQESPQEFSQESQLIQEFPRNEESRLNSPTEDQIRELSNSELARIPEGFGKIHLRILQCVREIGSVAVLDALKTAAAQPGELLPGPNHLLQIHRYLDTKGANNHLDVARTRYVKYCYYEAFHCEVQILTVKKRQSREERRRNSKRLLHDGLTPETDWIASHYNNPEGHGTLGSRTIVRRNIVNGIKDRYGGDSDTIDKDLTRYLRDGGIFHTILQGANPALLVLFPGEQHHSPSLSYLHLDDLTLRSSLQKPINPKNIDALNERDATWFGRAMEILRPELLPHCVVESAVKLLLGLPLNADEGLLGRAPNEFLRDPLGFLA